MQRYLIYSQFCWDPYLGTKRSIVVSVRWWFWKGWTPKRRSRTAALNSVCWKGLTRLAFSNISHCIVCIVFSWIRWASASLGKKCFGAYRKVVLLLAKAQSILVSSRVLSSKCSNTLCWLGSASALQPGLL